MTVIDDALKDFSQKDQEVLNGIRAYAHTLFPDLDETISYGMPTLKYNGKYLFAFSAFRDHLSLFPGAGPIEILKDELSSYKTSKGTIQFTLENQIPKKLLKQILMLCFKRANSN
jgi:uncharacterized protein YdhG (YjbR/CyaY superfamily)